jgi:hypothetical protein
LDTLSPYFPHNNQTDVDKICGNRAFASSYHFFFAFLFQYDFSKISNGMIMGVFPNYSVFLFIQVLFSQYKARLDNEESIVKKGISKSFRKWNNS